jgi:hypothetical protein
VALVAVLGLTVGALAPLSAGGGGKHRPDDKVRSILADHEHQIGELECRVRALEGDPCGATTTTTTAPPATSSTSAPTTTTVVPSTTTSTSTTSSTTTVPPTSTTSPPSGPCDYLGPTPTQGATPVGNVRLSAGEDFGNFNQTFSGGHGFLPPNVNGVTVHDGWSRGTGGDNIKLGDNSTYHHLWLTMSPSGGHLDAMQGQGATGVTIENVVIEMTSHSGVTGAILMQNLVGGGGGNRDITYAMNCVRIIGSGPFGHDIRIGAAAGVSTRARLTNIELDGGVILAQCSGDGVFELDASARAVLQNNGCTIVPI